MSAAKIINFNGTGMLPKVKPYVNVRVALGSGGLKGAYQYGFFKTLEKLDRERNMIRYDKVYGASIGSINAPFVARKRVHTLERIWEGRDPLKTVMKRDWLTSWGLGWLGKSLQCMIAVVFRGSWYKGYDEEVFRRAWDAADMDSKRGNEAEVGYVCVDVNKAEEVWGTVYTFGEWFEGVKRSAALPMLVPYYQTSENWFMDGGLSEDVPVGKLWDEEFDGIYLVFDNKIVLDTDTSDDVPVIGQYEKMLTVCRRMLRNVDREWTQLPENRTWTFSPCELWNGASMFATRKDLAKWIKQAEADAEKWYAELLKEFSDRSAHDDSGELGRGE